MKFKTVYVLFNTVILVSFAVIFFLPLLMLGPEYFAVFVSRSWIAGAIFLATLAVVNGYFLRSWKLFALLEQEDWPGVISLLEDRIYRRRRLRRGSIKMLVNAYLITSRTDAILRLGSFLEDNAPGLLARFALPLGIPYLLREDNQAAERYFGRFLGKKGVGNGEWLRWNYAFALLRQKQPEAARGALLELLERSPEPVLELLTLYLLDSVAGGQEEVRSRVEAGKAALQRRFSPEGWRRRVDSSTRNMEVALLAPVVRDASAWLYPSVPGSSGSSGSAGSPGPESVH